MRVAGSPRQLERFLGVAARRRERRLGAVEVALAHGLVRHLDLAAGQVVERGEKLFVMARQLARQVERLLHVLQRQARIVEELVADADPVQRPALEAAVVHRACHPQGADGVLQRVAVQPEVVVDHAQHVQRLGLAGGIGHRLVQLQRVVGRAGRGFGVSHAPAVDGQQPQRQRAPRAVVVVQRAQRRLGQARALMVVAAPYRRLRERKQGFRARQGWVDNDGTA